MRKTIMRVISLIMCCFLTACACGNEATTPVASEKNSFEPQQPAVASIDAIDAANALHALGLFHGTGIDADGNPIYELERTPNRHEAVTMIVRLLGKEATAKASSWSAPFTDVPDWAKPYVGYAYENGITSGTTNTTYDGTSNTTVSQYITLMLRALGYSSETEFKWDEPWELSDKIGMTNGAYNSFTKEFTRGDMAIISYSALLCKMKNGVTLYDYLVAESANAGEYEGEDKVKDHTVADTGEIITPYLTLYLDDAFKDHFAVVHNQGTPYILEFYAALENRADQHIFDILIGEGADGNIGMIETNLGKVPASMILYDFVPDHTWTEDEINTVFALQETSNDLVEQLMAHQINADNEAPEISTSEQKDSTLDTEIKTPYGTMYFPNKWKDYLAVEQIAAEEHSVMIYATLNGKSPVLLYTFVFGGDNGEQIGAVKNEQGDYVTVNILIEDLDNINYSEADIMILYEMQETVNTLITQLPLE